MAEENEQRYGLIDTPPDGRDFSFAGVFGLPEISTLPKEYRTSEPLIIKNQGQTDMCTAYASTAVSEDQDGIVLDPFYTFGKTKKIQGNPDEWGADLRSCCKAVVNFGFIPAVRTEMVRDTTVPPSQKDRDSAAWGNGFTEEDDAAALTYKKQSYFKVDGPYDIFDNMRATMWQNRDEERSILTGIVWRSSWNNTKGGVLGGYDKNEKGYGHAIKIFGWRGEYLVAQLSNGKEIGDGGLFYLPRAMVNAECTFGSYTFKDMPRESAELIHKSANAGIAQKISLALGYFWQTIMK